MFFGRFPRSGITRSQDMDIFIVYDARCQIALQKDNFYLLLCVFDNGLYKFGLCCLRHLEQSWAAGSLEFFFFSFLRLLGSLLNSLLIIQVINIP